MHHQILQQQQEVIKNETDMERELKELRDKNFQIESKLKEQERQKSEAERKVSLLEGQIQDYQKSKKKKRSKKNSVWTRDELEILKNGLASKDTASQIQKSLGSRSKNEVELKFSDFMQKPDFADLISKEQKEFDKKQVKKKTKDLDIKRIGNVGRCNCEKDKCKRH